MANISDPLDINMLQGGASAAAAAHSHLAHQPGFAILVHPKFAHQNWDNLCDS